MLTSGNCEVPGKRDGAYSSIMNLLFCITLYICLEDAIRGVMNGDTAVIVIRYLRSLFLTDFRVSCSRSILVDLCKLKEQATTEKEKAGKGSTLCR